MVKSNTKIKNKVNQATRNNFFRELKSELKKVTWPTRKVLIKSSSLIMIIVVFSTLYVMICDAFLMNVFEIIKKLNG